MATKKTNKKTVKKAKEVVVKTRKTTSKAKKTVATKTGKSGKVNKYELVVIYPLKVNEIAAEKDLGEKCKKQGFKIIEVDKWGVKTLGYQIKKETSGYYLRFVLEGSRVADLEKDLRIDDKLLRYLIIRI